ncbi:MAG: hypothetical protein NTX98_03340 [Candidatus Doudnabacteria bacterium]|nr:hypothetical protein [Candidatus Doudnabacteria bacterium]
MDEQELDRALSEFGAMCDAYSPSPKEERLGPNDWNPMGGIMGGERSLSDVSFGELLEKKVGDTLIFKEFEGKFINPDLPPEQKQLVRNRCLEILKRNQTKPAVEDSVMRIIKHL